jgi:hypothetical protein
MTFYHAAFAPRVRESADTISARGSLREAGSEVRAVLGRGVRYGLDSRIVRPVRGL